MRRNPLGELLHHLDLRVVLEQRQVAARHELDRDRHLTPDLEQRLDELVGRAGVRGPTGEKTLVITSERGRRRGRERSGRRGLHVRVLPVQPPDGVAVAGERIGA